MGSGRHQVHVAVIGAGFGGLGAAIQLKRALTDDFLVFERADDIGGTWYANTYPGCACDVPSHLYSFSFAPNPHWTRSYSSQVEIWQYLRDCVRRFGLAPHLRLGHEVTAVVWDEARLRWLIDTSRGEFSADVVVAAAGPLYEPAIPPLPGLDTFAGTTFHSARWDHGHDLTGRRVAVIGTGASAIQFVPHIQPKVEHLVIFQRTAPWILPSVDRPLSRFERWLYRSVPVTQRLTRTVIYWGRELCAFLFLYPPLMRIGEALARRHLVRSVSDSHLRARLQPHYTMGCKRILRSSTYLPTLAQENVTLETTPIRQITADCVITATGTRHRVDTIIFGTGFQVADPPMAHRIRSRDGRSLAEAWQGSPRAYLGMTVGGFPNLFLLLGPNAGLGHNSVILMIEAQLAYVLAALRYMQRTGIAALEPTFAAQQAFVSDVDRRMRRTVWARGGCHSWYVDATGRNFAIWPGFSWRYRWRTRRFDPQAYLCTPLGAGHLSELNTGHPSEHSRANA